MMKQRQKVKTDYNYKKLNKHSDSEDETELFVVRKSPPKKEIATIEKNVEEGDTLQSLAIRYCCTIEDLKRLNNIHKENEIFAKRIIKVPHYPLSAAIAGVHVSGRSSPNNSTGVTSTHIDTHKLSASLQENEVNQIIFNSHIITPQKSDDKEEVVNEDNEEVHLLPQETVVSEAITSRINCSGVDGDISLKALVICIVVVIFVVPLIYVFYIAEHPEQYHQHAS